jgi:hypothetical protein
LQELREDLVRAVRRPRALHRVPDGRRELLAEAGHLTVRVPVERERGELVRELLGEPVGQRHRALVRVEARGDGEMR